MTQQKTVAKNRMFRFNIISLIVRLNGADAAKTSAAIQKTGGASFDVFVPMAYLKHIESTQSRSASRTKTPAVYTAINSESSLCRTPKDESLAQE